MRTTVDILLADCYLIFIISTILERILQKWEYTCFYIEKEGLYDWVGKQILEKETWQMINDFGNKGWELVSVTPICDGVHGGTTKAIFTFKRPKE
ncbi:MAG: hypothetical protein CVU42_07575 [Chloroflexi bacterium HGW-Chloroflexi-4]|nr:MAG: hypothetical protein CVU42_07575 [Chloroflexi bacterium HGW-Chloroflexi-4]